MQWELHQAAHAFQELSDHWKCLNERHYYSHPLLDSRFASALLRHFGSAGTTLAVGSANGVPGCLLLLEKMSHLRWRAFVPSQAQIAPLQIGTLDIQQLSGLFQALPGYPLSIEFLSQDPCHSFQDRPFATDTVSISPHAVTVGIDATLSWDQYWAQRSRNLRKNWRRHWNHLRHDSRRVRLVVVNRPNEVGLAVDRYGLLESYGWKGTAGTALHPNNRQGHFYRDLLEEYSRTGSAAVYELWADDTLLSSRLALEGGGMMVILKTTYDARYRLYGPGYILLRLILQEVLEAGQTKRIEFYTNASREQLGWSTDSRTIQHVVTYRSAWAKQAARIAQGLRRRRASPYQRPGIATDVTHADQ